jgi:hypothetical protein
VGTGPARARPARVLFLAPESGLKTLAIAGLLLEAHHRELTRTPHTAGTEGSRRVAVVYVNHGQPEDYERLARIGVDVRGKVALARYFGGYRGGKSLGVPSADLVFDGPYGVYHSIYDSHEWMKRVGDPGFRYHAAMARLWGLLALRLASADVLPLDYGAFGRDLLAYLDDVATLARSRGVDAGLDRARRAAQALSRLGVSEPTGDATADAARCRALMQREPAARLAGALERAGRTLGAPPP